MGCAIHKVMGQEDEHSCVFICDLPQWFQAWECCPVNKSSPKLSFCKLVQDLKTSILPTSSEN